MVAMKTFDASRPGIGAQAVGIAQGALDLAIDYARTREQFGQAISSFQAIQHMLADMSKEIDVARLLTYRAAWMKDQDQDVNRQSATAKLMAAETAVRATNNALQIFGGYGYTKDYPAEKYFRDAKLCTIGEGTSEIMRLVISRQLIKTGAGIVGVE